MEPAKAQAKFNIRPANLEDIPFIFSSWLKSYRDAPAVRSVPNTIYYAQHHKIIEQIFSSKGLRVFIACDQEESSQIFSYVVGEVTPDGVTIHFIYSKFPFRNFGIATALEKHLTDLNPGQVQFSHAGKNHDRLIKNRKYVYNPYLVWSK